MHTEFGRVLHRVAAVVTKTVKVLVQLPRRRINFACRVFLLNAVCIGPWANTT